MLATINGAGLLHFVNLILCLLFHWNSLEYDFTFQENSIANIEFIATLTKLQEPLDSSTLSGYSIGRSVHIEDIVFE